MKRFICIGITVLLLCAAAFAQPSKVDDRLSQQLQSIPSDSLIPVWLVLPEVRPAAALKAVAPSATVPDRAQRYKARAAQLRQDHTNAQAGLVNYLASLERRGVVTDVKPHWLVNIVEARVRPDQIDALSRRPDIQTIHAVPRLAAFEPTEFSESSSSAALGANLTSINADDAWAAGYTGAGRIICSFDSGIDGVHPALFDSWKGHDGDSAAAWFDPLENEPFPHTLSGPSSQHGTHVMGLALGHYDPTGDTIGVAIDAKWISAAVIDVFGTSIIDAFEWVADPDRNPNTVDDLPDVINHSWGVEDVGCTDVFFQMIDNTEALGIVNVFAAGNEGSSSSTIRNPANRALDSIDCFAVGNVDARVNPPVIAGNSSRGPSDCNGAIKPNVSAPGVQVRSSFPGGTYGVWSGTSMATPHVAGLVALLRQKNPNATVDEIKTAILTTAQEYSYTLPNNDYGWGVIDCMAALNAISATNADPNLRVYRFDHDMVAPGDQFAGRVVLQNLGASLTNVTAQITGSDPSITIIDGLATFGTITEGDTVRAGDDIILQVSDTATVGRVISLDFELTGTGYSKTTKLHVLLEPLPERMKADLSSGKIDFTITNFGTYGLDAQSFYPAGGVGFRYNGGENEVWEVGFMIGQGFDQVSDGIRNIVGEPDGDFDIAPSGDLFVAAGANGIAQQSVSRFDDSRTEEPIGVEITQETFGYDTAPNDNFIIIRYEITNVSSQAISGVYAGLYVDWDVVNYPSNAGGWIGSSNLTWTAFNTGSGLSDYRGVTILEGQPSSGVTLPGSNAYYPEGFTEFEKFQALNNGFGSATIYANASMDLLQVTAVGPISLQPGESTTAGFAFVAAPTEQGAIDAAATAALRYAELPSGCCVDVRGDLNSDGTDLNAVDLAVLVDYLYNGLEDISPCRDETDVNGDGANGGLPNAVDLAYLVDYLFGAGAVAVDCP